MKGWRDFLDASKVLELDGARALRLVQSGPSVHPIHHYLICGYHRQLHQLQNVQRERIQVRDQSNRLDQWCNE